jgi:lipopolysaccharide export system permease protein
VKPGVFYEDLTNLTVYADKVNSEKQHWTHVLVHDDREPSSPLLVLAREGRVNPSEKGQALKLSLSDGQVHLAKRTARDYTIISFERAEIAVGVEDSIVRKGRLFRAPKEEMTPAELRVAAKQAEEEGSDPRPFLMAYHARLGQALTPLSFALLGAPLAMQRRQAGRARGFLLTIGGYILYYVLTRTSQKFGSDGKLPLILAGQLPNLIFAAVGMATLLLLSRSGAKR